MADRPSPGETPEPPPLTAPIPVMISRHSENLPEDYGARIPFSRGERVRIVSTAGRPDAFGVLVDGEMKWHNAAPMIDSSRGEGRWVYEVVFDGETAPCAISARQFKLSGEVPRD